MMPDAPPRGTLTRLDDATRELVRVAVVVTVGSEPQVRDALSRAQAPAEWIEELILQTYLFAGFPRALNAMREWRRTHALPAAGVTLDGAEPWRGEGERTCAAVYGDMYDKLRANIRDLHPLLD